MNFGIELRQRSRSGGSSGDYVRVQTDEWDDDDDDFHYHSMPPNGHGNSALRNRRIRSSGDDEDDDDDTGPPLTDYARRIKFVPKPPSNACLKFCVVLSIAGIVFLSIISYLLTNSSPYIRVSPEYSHDKPKLAEGINGAIFLYGVCLVISCYLWWRSHYRALGATDSRFMD